MPPKMTPKELVAEYKRSGKFDRLRREAMESFLASDHSATLTRRVDEIASDALRKVDHAHFVRQGQDALLGTIMNDLDRFPLVDRAMIAMSESLKDKAFLRNIADEVLYIINPPEPDKQDQISPEPEVNGVEPNNQTLANGHTHPHPLSIQNGSAIPVEGSVTRVVEQTPDRSASHIHGDVDSIASAHAPLSSQSQESPTPESAYDYDTNRPHDNGTKASAPQQPRRTIVKDDILIHRPPSSVIDIHAPCVRTVGNSSEARAACQELGPIALDTSFPSAEDTIVEDAPESIKDSPKDANPQIHASGLSPSHLSSLIPPPPRPSRSIRPNLEGNTNLNGFPPVLSGLEDCDSESSLSDAPE